jgi:hypothetical protein
MHVEALSVVAYSFRLHRHPSELGAHTSGKQVQESAGPGQAGLAQQRSPGYTATEHSLSLGGVAVVHVQAETP